MDDESLVFPMMRKVRWQFSILNSQFEKGLEDTLFSFGKKSDGKDRQPPTNRHQTFETCFFLNMCSTCWWSPLLLFHTIPQNCNCNRILRCYRKQNKGDCQHNILTELLGKHPRFKDI